MSISEKSLKTLEFDKIRLLLRDVCQTAGAKKLAETLVPVCEEERVRKAQNRTSDALRLYDDKGTPPFGHVVDIAPICERANKGATLSARELLDAAALLRSARLLREYIVSNKHFDTVLDETFMLLMPNRHIEDTIFRAVISEDMISDEASTTLADIRRKMRVSNAKIKDTLAKYISGSYSKYLQDNIVTMRNGRYVVPVRAECKNEIKGLIHDTSSSGATIFVEPMAVVEANNELRMLSVREEHEIEKILSTFSGEIAAVSSSLLANYENITDLSFAFGCAALSRELNAREPIISGKKKISLIKARHPLIDKDSVVPISVTLGDTFDTLVVTGPNTGGKTVTLKTLGLFAIMAQSGLHIPADEGSTLPIFDKILVDLGDEQSIEQSLSTFSSHMVTIIDIIKQKDSRSLVLFDELGAGTDPVEGAALAVAVIENVREAGALCVATTHYSELKSYALDTEGVCNASCEFDVETLRPTYRLIIGTPGKSNAFAISEKLGLPHEIIKRASDYVSTDNKQFEKVIGELEAARFEADKRLSELEEMKAEYEAFKKESEETIRIRLEASKKTVEDAQQKANAMVESAKISSEYIFAEMDKIRRAKESEKLSEELEDARKSIREHLRQNSGKYNPVEVKKNDKDYKLPRPLKKGDEVLIVSLDKVATVTEDQKGGTKISVQAGIIKTKADIKDLRLIEGNNAPQYIDSKTKKRTPTSSFGVSVSRDFRDEIDLRGLTGDEAWSKVDKYLDEAIVSGFHTLRLIHGKGTGALKNALWQYLKGDRRIANFRIGQYGEGDGGVTVVELR